MAWNDNPQVRDLAAWSKKHGYTMVVAVVFQNDLKGGVGYVSYGCDKTRCDWAKQIGDRIYADIMDAKIDVNYSKKPLTDSS